MFTVQPRTKKRSDIKGSPASNAKSRPGRTPAKEFNPVGLLCLFNRPPPGGGCRLFSLPTYVTSTE